MTANTTANSAQTDAAYQLVSRQTLGDLLRRTCRRYPDRLAIRCGAVDWTYSEFDAICTALATGLKLEGVQTGDRVAVLARNSHAFAALRFALARLGAVLVPINFMLSATEALYILEHSGSILLSVDSAMTALGLEASKGTAVQKILWLPSEHPSKPAPGLITYDQCLTSGSAALASDTDLALSLGADINARSLLQIIYTSGTESRPKGAMLSHEAVIAEYVTCVVDAEIAERDRILHALPLYHCAQLDVFLGPGVYLGALNVITSDPSASNLLALMQSNRINSFFAPPTVWISLLRSPELELSDLSALSKGYYGASIMPVEVLKELQRRLPEVRLWNLYGQTEIAPLATVLKPEDQLRKAGSAGRPALNVETRVVDDDMNDVAVGAVGEIVHRSPQLLQGYFNNAERSRAAFAGGWFHSGDLATVDEEGYITVVDRKKDMIKTGGENVASREVEEAIYTIDGVSEVAVIGLPDPRWVEAVTAVVVPKAGATLTEATIINGCHGRLASFKIPKRVILTESLPKNPSGKLLKRALRDTYAAGA